MKELIEFFNRASAIPTSRLALMAGVAGISNAMILGLLNAAAANASRNQGLGSLLAMFLAAILIYIYSQKYLFVTTTVEFERIIHQYRMRQVERVRHCDLDALEAIGPARIFGALTRQPQVLSTAIGPIILGFQSGIVVAFTLVYLAWLSVAAAVLTVAILGLAIFVYQIRMKSATGELIEANTKENELFNAITDLLDGFKEIRLNVKRSTHLAEFIHAISHRVFEVKTGVDVKLTEMYLFAQLTFYCTAGALVFLLPGLGFVQSEELLKTTTAILFLIGPITSVAGSSSAVANATAACRTLDELERELEQAEKGSRASAEQLERFEEIALKDVVYQHKHDSNGGFTVGPINVALRRGDLMFISGGNGSGKSTLLKLLTALYMPQSGQLLVDGRLVDADLREAYQNLFSTVFSDFHLFQRLFGLGDVAPQSVAEWLQAMEIDGKTSLKGDRFDTIRLSTGQRKRLALVVAALEDRPICVFDEFAADQDPTFRRKFYDEILPALRERGKTVIVVTHDERYFDRASRHLMMEEGRLVERGTPDV